ncbi:hypothetical protein [Teredinibacter waterburyi]|jgi:hypothetical protein|uniref:hypothetical protein n=1 Tax=Teredinibacter waterburyi TaxID=1500538 RepID=UPI00165F33DB|nr:hypothetical protein [Teredinibacter waterburyi]
MDSVTRRTIEVSGSITAAITATIAIVTAILVAIAPTAEAATKQIFSGTLCESLYDKDSIYGAGIHYQYGGIWNQSTTNWAYIDCPVPRANGFSSGTIADLEVAVTDTDGDMWCQAINRNRYDGAVAVETAYSGGTGNRIIDFGSVAGTSYEGHITVFCVLPKNGGKVHSISVDINE